MNELNPPEELRSLADAGGGRARLPPQVRLADHFPTSSRPESYERERRTKREFWQMSSALLALLHARGSP